MEIRAIKWDDEYGLGLATYAGITLEAVEHAIQTVQRIEGDEVYFVISDSYSSLFGSTRIARVMRTEDFSKYYGWVTKEGDGDLQPVYERLQETK